MYVRWVILKKMTRFATFVIPSAEPVKEMLKIAPPAWLTGRMLLSALALGTITIITS